MKKYIQITVGAFLVALLTWLLFRDTDWPSVWASIKGVNIGWLVISQVFGWGAHFIRVQRWSYIVRAGNSASFRNLFSATQIGFLFNFTVPARLGEVVRAYVLSRLEKLPLSQTVTMAALDRVNDILGLIVVFFVAMLAFPSDRNIEFAAGVVHNAEPIVVSSSLIQILATNIIILLVIIIALLVILYLNQNFVLRIINICAGLISKKLAELLSSLFLNIAAGMHIFRSASDQIKAFFFSLLTWGAGLISIAAILIAFNIDYPWYTPFVVLTMISLFISFPVIPGMVGQYHIAIVSSLLLVIPGMDLTKAKALAIVTHLLGLIPVAGLGLFSLYREGFSFMDCLPSVKTGKMRSDN